MEFYDDVSRKDGSFPYFLIGLTLIVVLNVFSIFYYFFNLFVAIRVKHYKTNLQIIHQAIYATCPISSLFLIVEKSLIILGRKGEMNDSENQLKIVLEWIRSATLSPPLFSLVGITLERVFATYFVRDYEQKPRNVIGYGVILLLFLLSLLTSYIFNATDHIFIFVTLHFFSNILSYLVALITYRINRNYYHNNRNTTHSSYSLGERFQIAENIRMYKFFSVYIFILAFFTISCTGLALISNYDTSTFHRNILSVIFDLCFSLLCIFAPYITIKMSEAWQNELSAIYIKIGLKRVTKVENVAVERSKRLKNTFGEVMEFETSRHSDVYFNQLKRSWNGNTNSFVKV